MPDLVSITFLYAIGQRVRWRGEPLGRWRVIARLYEQSRFRADVRYQLRAMNDTHDVVVYEDDLSPLEEDT
jgi:hypothetical protein